VIFVEDSPREARSFTDETSPQKPSSDRKISIHGQVIKDLSLSWYYDLMKLYPGESAEVKSTRILQEFHNLPRDFRERVWSGMKRVIINIVDSLSYQTDLKQILSDIYENDKIHEMLKRNARQGDAFARQMLRRMDETVTLWIIQDSPPERLRRSMRPHYFPGSLSFYLNRPDRNDDEIDLSPFRAKRSSMTGKAVKYACKSGSVFNPARDQINPMLMLHNESWTRYMARRKLRESHAFDRGDDQSVKWIDNQRKAIARGGYDFNYDENDNRCLGDGFGPLYSISSDTSSYTQSADIAAGFARQDYERYGIAAVAGRFDYVTLNGERITQDNAEERFEYWRQLVEREKRSNRAIAMNN
jgi:hypothetical protein